MTRTAENKKNQSDLNKDKKYKKDAVKDKDIKQNKDAERKKRATADSTGKKSIKIAKLPAKDSNSSTNTNKEAKKTKASELIKKSAQTNKQETKNSRTTKVTKKKSTTSKDDLKLSVEEKGDSTSTFTVPTRLMNKKYNLVVVESPAKAQTIKKYLGRGHEVIASNGHIKDLPKSKLGVDVDNNFAIDMTLISGKKAVVERLQKYIANAEQIYLAPDPDREGEAIAFHIADIAKDLGKKKNIIKRVLFNSITRSSVKEAMEHPTELNQYKYESQKARRVLDRLVGYKISPILWEKVQRGLSAGRVQSVALRMIVEREEEIKAFVPEQWFSISAELKNQNSIIFRASYYGETAQKKNELLDKAVVDKILSDIKGHNFKVVDLKMRERKQNPTPPFTTSKLQQEAANKLSFPAKKTMMVAQKLYEGIEIAGQGMTGLITYMRTDSVRTDPTALTEVRKFIENKYGRDYLPEEPIIYKRKGNNKIQDAHEAIRPASLEFPPELVKNDLGPDEYKLYELIWNKFVSSQMAQSLIDQTTVSLEVNNHFFKAFGSIIKFPGFRTVYLESKAEKRSKRGGSNGSEDGNEDSEASGENGGNGEGLETNDLNDSSENGADEGNAESFDRSLPKLSVGEVVSPIKDPESREHWTSPPPRYSDASIVKDLEEKGIGRPSTYASIISNIVDRGYVEKKETRYYPTELGSVVCNMLITSFPNIMDIEFTAKVEGLLDRVEEGDVKWTKVLNDFWVPFELTLKKAKDEMKNLKKIEVPTGIQCPKCKTGEYMIKWGRNGQFFACSNYPECTSTEDFVRHLDGSYEIIPKKYTDKKCASCGQRMIVKKGRFGQFLACEDYPNCKTTAPYTLNVICPDCKTNELAEKRSRFGRPFYGCSGYPNCNFAMWWYPVQKTCPHCECTVLGQRESKKAGKYFQCPKCKKSIKPESEEH